MCLIFHKISNIKLTEALTKVPLSLMKITINRATQQIPNTYMITRSGGSRKKIFGGAWPLIIWEATTAKRNYYRTISGVLPKI